MNENVIAQNDFVHQVDRANLIATKIPIHLRTTVMAIQHLRHKKPERAQTL